MASKKEILIELLKRRQAGQLSPEETAQADAIFAEEQRKMEKVTGQLETAKKETPEAFTDTGEVAAVETGPTLGEQALAGAAGVSQGLTFGFGDEIAEGVGQLTGDEQLQQAGELNKRLREQSPVAFTGGEIAGAVASPLPFAAAKGATTGAKMGLGALTGAGAGALTGAGTAEGGLEERVEGALEGAAFGAALGGLLPGAGKALEKGKDVGKRVAVKLTGNPVFKSTKEAREAVLQQYKNYAKKHALTKARGADVVDELTDAGVFKNAFSLNKLSTNLDAALEKQNEKFAKMMADTDTVKLNANKWNEFSNDLGSKFEDIKQGIAGRRGELTDAQITNLQGRVDEVMTALKDDMAEQAPTGKAFVKIFDEFKRKLQASASNSYKDLTVEVPIKELNQSLARVMRSATEDLAELTLPGAKKQLKDINRARSAMYTVRDTLDDQLIRQAQGTTGGGRMTQMVNMAAALEPSLLPVAINNAMRSDGGTLFLARMREVFGDGAQAAFEKMTPKGRAAFITNVYKDVTKGGAAKLGGQAAGGQFTEEDQK